MQIFERQFEKKIEKMSMNDFAVEILAVKYFALKSMPSLSPNVTFIQS